jgi:hypothetical protein
VGFWRPICRGVEALTVFAPAEEKRFSNYLQRVQNGRAAHTAAQARFVLAHARGIPSNYPTDPSQIGDDC